MAPLRMRVLGMAALIGGLAIATSDVQGMNAQTAAAPATQGFEVASVRPHAGEDDHQETNLLPGGRYVGTNATVRKLIRLAFGVEDEQIVGAPGWIDKDRYDIDAKDGVNREAGAAGVSAGSAGAARRPLSISISSGDAGANGLLACCTEEWSEAEGGNSLRGCFDEYKREWDQEDAGGERDFNE